MKKSRGKQSLPYLLSTTKTLLRCKQYYYKGIDFKFSSHRNRDCYTERNVRINMTRQWHNVILPNAILSSMYGTPATIEDAIDALNYAMSHGKTQRSLEAWNSVCEAERKLSGTKDSVVYKYTKSFYFFALGMGATLDGKLYHLKKDLKFDIKKYLLYKDVSKYIYKGADCWRCPWDDLNTLVYKYKHYKDAFYAECDRLNDERDKIIDKYSFDYFDDAKKRRDAEIAVIEKQLDDLDEPFFPDTQRAIVAEFGVSMSSATRFRRWLKQLWRYAEDKDALYDERKISWTPPKSVKDKSKQDFIDIKAAADVPDDAPDDAEDSDESIDTAIQRAVDSGDRPVGRWSEQSL